jgi:hypothetical protein
LVGSADGVKLPSEAEGTRNVLNLGAARATDSFRQIRLRVQRAGNNKHYSRSSLARRIWHRGGAGSRRLVPSPVCYTIRVRQVQYHCPVGSGGRRLGLSGGVSWLKSELAAAASPLTSFRVKICGISQ